MKELLNTIPKGRLVAILTPLLFAPLAGLIVLYAAKLGVDLPKDQTEKAVIETFGFGLGALIAYLKSRQWLAGNKEWEQLEEKLKAEFAIETVKAEAEAQKPVVVVDSETELSEAEVAKLEADTEEFDVLGEEPTLPNALTDRSF